MQLDLRDGTWDSSATFFSPKRRWNHLQYWKRVGGYTQVEVAEIGKQNLERMQKILRSN